MLARMLTHTKNIDSKNQKMKAEVTLWYADYDKNKEIVVVDL